MPRLLVVHHSPTPLLRGIADAVLGGAAHPDLDGVEVVELAALDADAEAVLAADAYVLGSPANFGYLSGALKHFFDVTYDAVRDPTRGRPFSYWIHGGHDTTGAERAMQSITTGLGWSLAAEPLVRTGELTTDDLELAAELGATLAATVAP